MRTCDELTFRRACAEDSVPAIAKYIYLTDPYIYPTICNSPEDSAWVELIHQCMAAEDNLFSTKHLYLALRGEDVVGICCVIPCGKRLRFLEDVRMDGSSPLRLEGAVEGYFRPLLEESAEWTGYNITNICVDGAIRGQGIGRRLLAYVLSQLGDSEVYLDVLADNANAIRLYEGHGFRIVNAYKGFSGTQEEVPCYHMRRMPTSDGNG